MTKNKITMTNLLDAKILITIMKGVNQNIKAIATLDFGDFKIKGFRVRSDENGSLWVNPPVIPRAGKTPFIVFYAEDKELWHALQAKILEAYRDKDNEIPIIE